MFNIFEVLIYSDCDLINWSYLWNKKGSTKECSNYWTLVLISHGLGGLLELVMDGEAWHAVVHEIAKSQNTTERLNWTELNYNMGPMNLAIAEKLQTFEGNVSSIVLSLISHITNKCINNPCKIHAKLYKRAYIHTYICMYR